MQEAEQEGVAALAVDPALVRLWAPLVDALGTQQLRFAATARETHKGLVAPVLAVDLALVRLWAPLVDAPRVYGPETAGETEQNCLVAFALGFAVSVAVGLGFAVALTVDPAVALAAALALARLWAARLDARTDPLGPYFTWPLQR